MQSRRTERPAPPLGASGQPHQTGVGRLRPARWTPGPLLLSIRPDVAGRCCYRV